MAIVSLLLLISLKRIIGIKANRINDFAQPKFVIENVTLQHFQLLRLWGGITEAGTQGSRDPEKATVQFLLHFKWPINFDK